MIFLQVYETLPLCYSCDNSIFISDGSLRPLRGFVSPWLNLTINAFKPLNFERIAPRPCTLFLANLGPKL